MGFAANSQSINDYRRTHQNLLAKQNNIKDKIKNGALSIETKGCNIILYQDNRRIKICNASKA